MLCCAGTREVLNWLYLLIGRSGRVQKVRLLKTNQCMCAGKSCTYYFEAVLAHWMQHDLNNLVVQYICVRHVHILVKLPARGYNSDSELIYCIIVFNRLSYQLNLTASDHAVSVYRQEQLWYFHNNSVPQKKVIFEIHNDYAVYLHALSAFVFPQFIKEMLWTSI